MDPLRDNPLIRFTTFWWGIGTFFIFALLLLVVSFINRNEPTSLEDAAAIPRYITKAKIENAQSAIIKPENIDTAIHSLSQILAASKPVAVELPSQVVPGSETAKKMAAAPAADTGKIDVVSIHNEAIDPAVMDAGKVSYMLCAACHGQNGEGGPIAPPLAGSEWVTGPISNLILIQLRGLQGAISVSGKEYNMPGGMAALSFQSNEQISAVLTYIRNSFGNKASSVKPEQVQALRSEVGKPQVFASELKKP